MAKKELVQRCMCPGCRVSDGLLHVSQVLMLAVLLKAGERGRDHKVRSSLHETTTRGHDDGLETENCCKNSVDVNHSFTIHIDSWYLNGKIAS